MIWEGRKFFENARQVFSMELKQPIFSRERSYQAHIICQQDGTMKIEKKKALLKP